MTTSTKPSSARWVYMNGQFVPEHEARVPLYDSALTMGDMAFEVTRTCAGKPYRLEEHLARLAHTLKVLEINPHLTHDELLHVTHETLDRNRPTEPQHVDWNIIHNISRGPASGFRGAFGAGELRPTVIVSCYPLREKMAQLAPLYARGVDLVIPAQRSLPGELLDPTIKCRSRVHYQIANLQAEQKRPGASAVMLDPEGYLTECTTGNVFIVAGEMLRTPTRRNLLSGITRGVVLELAQKLGVRVEEANIPPDEALAADEMFITSTSIGILHVRSLEAVKLGDGTTGPLTQRLRAALHAEMGVDIAAQAQRYAAEMPRTPPDPHLPPSP